MSQIMNVPILLVLLAFYFGLWFWMKFWRAHDSAEPNSPIISSVNFCTGGHENYVSTDPPKHAKDKC